jgi:alpha-beta hydrolase superfamily lysophospholipase
MEPKCIPRFYPASNTTKNIGTIVIWDGFTTCWQQSENFAEVLSNEGYNIIQPNHLGVASNEALLTLTNAAEYWALPESATAYSEQVALVNKALEKIPRDDHQV